MKPSEIHKTTGGLILLGFVLVLSTLAVSGMIPDHFGGPPHPQPVQPSFNFSEGPVLTPSITVGPFDIHRRYRSMEGPFVDTQIKMGDLAEAQNVVIPEGMVKFV